MRFLDIGAGPGIALDVAQKRFGWQPWGIEPHKGLCKALWRRGHVMHEGTLETFPTGPLLFSFDDHAQVHVAMLYEMLEHQICPEATLLRVWELLEPGGVLIVVVPNDYNPLQLAACKKRGLPPYWLAPPMHLQMFTPKTLQLLVRRCGFQILDMRGTFPMERFLLGSREGCYVGNDTIGRACHTRRMAYELEAVQTGRWPQVEQTYRMNMAQRIGRELVFICRRQE